MKKLMVCLLLSTALLVSCTSKKESNNANTASNNDKNTVQNSNIEKTDAEKKDESNTKSDTEKKSENNANNNTEKKSENNTSTDTKAKDTNPKVKAKVQLYAGAYFDSKIYGENRPNPYDEVVISNITDTSFDFTVNQLEYTDIKNSANMTRKLIFKTNTAVFIGDGTKAAFYGKDYTLNFTFPNDRGALPVVIDMKITGFKPLEGNTYNNNAIPGHEFS